MGDEYCKVFCKGKSCIYEVPLLEKEKIRTSSSTIAIYPLLSNWITDAILATQRPSQIHILHTNLVQKFKDNGITGIFNLQVAGEHAHCFQGLVGDFSYDPLSFTDQGIQFFPFGWIDMKIPTTDLVLRMVQVMDMHIKEGGKIAVHCHAGLGRTGLAIACYFLYSQTDLSADRAIEIVRSRRPGSVQNSAQVKFIKTFKVHLDKLNDLSDPKVDLIGVARHQELLLTGIDRLRYKNVPRAMVILCSRICSLEKPIDPHDKSSDLGILDFLKVNMTIPPLDWSQDDCFRAILAFYKQHKFSLKHVNLDVSLSNTGFFTNLNQDTKIFVTNLLYVFQPLLLKSLISMDDLMFKLTAIFHIPSKTEYFVRSILEVVQIEDAEEAPYFSLKLIPKSMAQCRWKSFAV